MIATIVNADSEIHFDALVRSALVGSGEEKSRARRLLALIGEVPAAPATAAPLHGSRASGELPVIPPGTPLEHPFAWSPPPPRPARPAAVTSSATPSAMALPSLGNVLVPAAMLLSVSLSLLAGILMVLFFILRPPTEDRSATYRLEESRGWGSRAP